MKRDLKLFFEEFESKLGKKLSVGADFERFKSVFTKYNIHLHPAALKGIWGNIKGMDKLSPETLDRIALLMGFQSWHDLRETLHGDDDGEINYESSDYDNK